MIEINWMSPDQIDFQLPKSYICRGAMSTKTMHESLIKYVTNQAVTPLTENDVEAIKNIFVPKHFRKRQYLLQEGEVSKYAAFVVKGAMRQYSIDDKGVEHIVRLSIENWWVGDRESSIMLTPSIYNIDAWEDTDVLLITSADFVTRLNNIAAFGEMFRKLDQRHALAMQKRLNAAISMTAEQRYYDLERTYPEFLQRFPQHIIASYLGITKETLSRIRKPVLKK
jgi:CRP-like cAMP-binding protein